MSIMCFLQSLLFIRFLILNNFFAFLSSFPFLLVIRPYAVIISVPPDDQFLSLFLLSRIIKSKLVVDYRDEFEDYLIATQKRSRFFYVFMKELLSHLYRQAHLVTPVTPAFEESLKKRGVYNVEVVHDGVDTSLFRPRGREEMRNRLGLPEDTFIIVFSGSVYSPYRLDIVVEALKILKERKATNGSKFLLLIVGGGEIERILDLANSLQIKEMVRHVGPFNELTEVAELLNAADVGIIPYDNNQLWEKTLSTKLFEYCACGVPVLATVTKQSILAKYIKNSKIGLVVPPLNSQLLAKALEKLCVDSETRTLYHTNALHFAKKWDKRKISENLLYLVTSERVESA